MKGINKNLFVITFLSLIFSASSFFNSYTMQAAGNKVTQAQEASILSDLTDLIKNNWERIKDLEYFTSKSLTIALPNNQELYIDWGFAGSGDILSGFPKIEIVFRTTTENKDSKKNLKIGGTESDNSSFSLLLLKIFLKSKLKVLKETFEQYSKEFAVFDWILKVDQSPFAPFVLKVLLLSKHSFDGDNARRNIEIVRLIIRLVQSGLFNTVDYQKSLFSYLPESVKEFLDQNLSGDVTTFIDEVWASFGRGFKEYEFDSTGSYDSKKIGTFASGYVFDDAKIASDCFDKIRAKKDVFSGSAFEDKMGKIIPTTYETIDFKDFAKYKGMKNYKFVGYHNFGRVNKDSVIVADVDKYLPEKMKNEILSATGLPKILKVEISDKETWILFATEKLNFFETIKMSFVSFLKGYEEFKQIRTKDLSVSDEIVKKAKLSDIEVIELKDLYSKKNNLKIDLDAFEIKRKKAEEDLKKRKTCAGKDQFSQDLLKVEQEKYDQLLKEGLKFKENLARAEKRIKELEIKAADNLLELAPDAATMGKNAFKLLLNVFVTSPELSEMFAAFKGNDPKYKDIRKNIVRRLTYVFRNAEDFKENLEIYQYLMTLMFPEFKGEFDKLKSNSNHNGNTPDLLDGVFSALGL